MNAPKYCVLDNSQIGFRDAQSRLSLLDAVLPLTRQGTHLFYKLRDEAARLRRVMDDLAGTAGRDGAWEARSSAAAYAAAEAAWQTSGGFAAGGASRAEQQPAPASWRLPDRPKAKVAVPTIRLDVDTEPRVTVHIARSAHTVMVADCRRHRDMETGGWLIGRVAAGWHKDRDVLGALPAVAARTRGSVRLDPEEFRRTDTRLDAGEGDFRCVGDWHTHPTGAGTPSAADLKSFALDLATIADHTSSLTSLILTQRAGAFDDSWARPNVSAWITRHARSSFGERMVCEPAMVKIG
jgi:proteasome lid subunit RPN8/RPN11